MIYGGGTNLMQLQRAMIFVDGTNLFYRLEAAKLAVDSLADLFHNHNYIHGGRQVIRICLYTIQEQLDWAISRHGKKFIEGIRVVLGHGIPSQGGNVKEKGVDALLVADLVYHAASRNYDYAVLVSTDTDFVHAIHRVEDFGCRTSVVGVCSEVPDRLVANSDKKFIITRESLVQGKVAKEI
jgi:uncharacterized LabA/DUF88 family protein